MDALEGRDVAYADIPGAFLQTEASDDTIIKLQEVLVITLLKVMLINHYTSNSSYWCSG